MPYIGRDLNRGNYLKLDDISSSFDSSTTTFNLTVGGSAFTPGSAFSILVSVGGVIQEPESAYQVNNSEITFANAPTAQDSFFCIALGVSLGIGVPGNGTVNGPQLAKPFNYDGFFYLDDANNRVGINSSAPKVALDVNGNAKISGILTASSFSGGSGGINAGVVTCTGLDVNGNGDISGNLVLGGDLTVNGTTTTLDTNLTEVDRVEIGANSSTLAGIAVTQSGTADLVQLYDGSTQVVTIDDEGKVGLGTDAPASNLHINAAVPNIRFTDSDTGQYSDISQSGHSLYLSGDRGASGSGGIIFRTQGTDEKLRITSTGALIKGNSGTQVSLANGANTQLIGTAGADASLALVRQSQGGGEFYFAAGSSGTNIANNNGLGFIKFMGYHTNGYDEYARIQAYVDGTNGDGDAPGRLSFRTTPDNSATSVERLRINSTGHTTIYSGAHDNGLDILAANNNQETRLRLQGKASDGTAYSFYLNAKRSQNRLDIGTISGAAISVMSTLNVGIQKIGSESPLQVGGGTSPHSTKPTVQIAPSTGNAMLTLRGGAPTLYFDRTSGGLPTVLTDGADLIIKNGSIDSGGNERLRITSTGSVGIGTNNPDVGNTAYPVCQVHGTSTNAYFKLTNTTTGVGSGDGVELSLSGSDAYLTNRESANIIFRTGGSNERLRITSDGTALFKGNGGNFEQVQTNPYNSSWAAANGKITIKGDLSGGNYWGWRQKGVASGSVTQANAEKKLPTINDFTYPNSSNGLLIASTTKIGFSASAESPQYANGVTMLFDANGLILGTNNAFDCNDSVSAATALIKLRGQQGKIELNNPSQQSGRLTIKGTNSNGSTCYAITNSGKALQGIDITCTTVGDGNYGGAISLGCGGNGRSAIAAVQKGSDDDVNGLAFFTHGSSTGADNTAERLRITSSGRVNIGGNYTQNNDQLHIIANTGKNAIGFGATTQGMKLGWDGDESAYDHVRIYHVDYNNAGTYGIANNNPTTIIQSDSVPGSGTVNSTFWFRRNNSGNNAGRNIMNVCVDGDVTIGGAGKLNNASIPGVQGSKQGGFGVSKLTIQPDDRTTAFNASDGDTWHDVIIKQRGGATNNAAGIAFQVADQDYHKNAGTGICAVKNGTNSDYGSDLVFITRPQSAQAKERLRIESDGNLIQTLTSPSGTSPFQDSHWYDRAGGHYTLSTTDHDSFTAVRTSSGGTYDNLIYKRVKMSKNCDIEFDLSGNSPSGTYRHIGFTLNADGSSANYDRLVFRSRPSSTSSNQIRIDKANGGGYGFQKNGSYIPTFFDGTERHIIIQLRERLVNVLVDGVIIISEENNADFYNSSGWFGFAIYEGGESAQVTIRNLEIRNKFQRPHWLARASQNNVDLSSGDALPYNTVIKSSSSMANTSDYNNSSYRFNVPINGVYYVFFRAYRNSSTSTEVAFYVNGNVRSRFRPQPNSGDYIFTGSCLLQLAKGDYIDVRAHNGTFDNFYGNNDESFSSWGGHLLD